MRRLPVTGLLPAVITLCLAAVSLPRAAFPVIGYWASWSGGINQIDYANLTHINYSFGRTNGQGTITGIDDGDMRDLVTRSHQAGVKVGLALGGWGAHGDFIALVANAASVDAFVANAVALCDKYSLDGIDMDWEYPEANTAAAFESLMKKLGDALHAKGKFLSAAVIDNDPDIGGNIRAAVFASIDFLNIMAYDGGGQNHSPYDLAVQSMDYWVKTRGCPKGKAVLGVPFYGRTPEMTYKQIIAADASAAQRDNSGTVYYNGIPTMQKKTQLAFDVGGGIMIWEIGQDTHDGTSLLKAIADKARTFPSALRPGAAETPLLTLRDGRLRFRATASGAYALTLRGLSGTLVREFPAATAGPGGLLDCDMRGLRPGYYSVLIRGWDGVVFQPIWIPWP